MKAFCFKINHGQSNQDGEIKQKQHYNIIEIASPYLLFIQKLETERQKYLSSKIKRIESDKYWQITFELHDNGTDTSLLNIHSN